MDVAALLESLDDLPDKQRDVVRAKLRAQLAAVQMERISAERDTVSLRSLLSACLYAANPERHPGIVHEPIGERDNIARADDIRRQLCERLDLLRACRDSPELQRQELERMRSNPAYFFNNYIYMQDPRVGLTTLPFELFPFQERMVEFIDTCYREQRSGIIKKSRDMGASVICIGYGLLHWLTEMGAQIAYGSRKEVYVHKIFDMDSLLEKARFIILHLPDWMVPPAYRERRHFNHMNIINPSNGAQLKGEGGDELGRGGRASIFFADEFAYVRRQEASHQSLSGTTDCVIYLSTSAGPNTYFFELERRQVYNVLSLPWYHDPRKVDDPATAGNPLAPSQWKRSKMETLSTHGFAREYACDDSHALESILIPPEWVASATRVDIKADPLDITVAGLDLSTNIGRDSTVLVIRQGPVVRKIHVWPDGATMEQVAIDAVDICTQYDVMQLAYDRSGIGSSMAGELRKLRDDIKFRIAPVNNSKRPSATRYRDSPAQPAARRFKNVVTEMWWCLRLRCEMSNRIRLGLPGEREDAILIPDDSRLRRELASREIFETSNGLISINEKGGFKSPDYADALALCEVPYREPKKKKPRPLASAVPSKRTGGAW